MSIQAVIFDFGGVLIRTEDRSGRAKWEQRLGLPERSLGKIVFECPASARATVGEIHESAIWKELAATYGLNDGQLREFRRDFFSGDAMDAELVSFLRSLRPRYKTGILSNAWSGARRAFTDLFGFGDAVDTIVISAEEGVAKPDPAIYHIALNRLGVRSEEAVFVDDMEENVLAANALGMFGVQFKTREQAIADVQHILDGRR